MNIRPRCFLSSYSHLRSMNKRLVTIVNKKSSVSAFLYPNFRGQSRPQSVECSPGRSRSRKRFNPVSTKLSYTFYSLRGKSISPCQRKNVSTYLERLWPPVRSDLFGKAFFALPDSATTVARPDEKVLPVAMSNISIHVATFSHS